ncbi:MAG: hypothetical protein Kow0069_33250 [Promethearchaeota archaeon]
MRKQMDPPIDVRMRDHPNAPRWNYQAGDKLDEGTFQRVKQFEEALSGLRDDRAAWLENVRRQVEETLRVAVERTGKFGRAARKLGLQPRFEFLEKFPTTDRSCLAKAPWELVPAGDPSFHDQMVMYFTTGTTGHPIGVPQHPYSVALYGVLLKEALGEWGVSVEFGPDRAGVILVGYQNETLTYATSLKVFEGAGFAKLNLHPLDWSSPSDPCTYLNSLEPQVLTGDPVSFVRLAELYQQAGLEPFHPKAMVTTAVALSPKVRSHLERAFGCPVIDWYSLTETGPLGYACRAGRGYHVLPPDVHFESLRSEGDEPAAAGQVGEVTVTGGRNPYLPLVRYRTGDWGRLDWEPCSCGDAMPRLVDLEGRRPVVYRDSKGGLLNNADVAAILRKFPILEFEFVQFSDLSVQLRFATIPGEDAASLEGVLRRSLLDLFGDSVEVTVEHDPSLVGRDRRGKARPFRSQIPFYYD